VFPPLLTLITNAFLRPQALARNLASVGRQTRAEVVEQLVLPDHVGLGFGEAIYGRVAHYAEAVHGQYVGFLNDDDALSCETAVAQFEKFVERRKYPPLVIVKVRKGEAVFPKCAPEGAPVEGDVDLGSYLLRADIWRGFVGDYGRRYQGDYDHAAALHAAGVPPAFLDLLWAEGPQGGGRPELSL
jgi:hypothetical protein